MTKISNGAMSFEASLKIVLKADDVTVAESEDVELWQYVLSQLSSEGAPPKVQGRSTEKDGGNRKRGEGTPLFSEEESTESELAEAIAKFSSKLGVDEDVLRGACTPRLEPPYVHLDKHHWQELKEELPSRGRNAIPSIVIAASILAAWLEEAKPNKKPTIEEAQSVLKSIDTRDRNPGRGISNCEWLQEKDGVISVHPAKIDMAMTVVRAYCEGEKPEFEE